MLLATASSDWDALSGRWGVVGVWGSTLEHAVIGAGVARAHLLGFVTGAGGVK
jgi:hypothetical protein